MRVLAGLLDVFGLILLWKPDVTPEAVDVWRGLVVPTARLIRWVSGGIRRLGGRPRDETVLGTAAGASATAGLAEGDVGIGSRGTLEERVRRLIERDWDVQRRLNALQRDVAAEAEARRRSVEELRAEAEGEIRRAIEELQIGDRRLRVVGTALLLAGSLIGTLG